MNTSFSRPRASSRRLAGRRLAYLAPLSLWLLVALPASSAVAQELTPEEIAWLRGHRFDPSIAGGWARKAAEARVRREELRRSGRLQAMSQAEAAAQGAALTGNLHLPVLAVIYPDVPEPFSTSDLDEALLGAGGGAGLVSLAEYYGEVSQGLLELSGAVTPWIVLDSVSSYYLRADEYGWAERGRFDEWVNSVFDNADPIVDFGAFDNDGPDGVPNSGDDDGLVDLLVILYATNCQGEWRDGFIWPGGGSVGRVTDDPSANGGYIRTGPAAFMNAQRGSQCVPVYSGVLAHEVGHAFGLPDLYDYDFSSNGIGYWGLMGYGLYKEEYSPTYLSAWSRDQLGWISVSQLPGPGSSVQLEPTELAHFAYRYDPPGASEFFLLENRQRMGTDGSLPGTSLLLWHVDPETPTGNDDEERKRVDVEEADGLNHLDLAANLGDAGDPFPGSSNNRRFGPLTDPSSTLNTGDESGLLLYDIAEDAGLRVVFTVLPLGAIAEASPDLLLLTAVDGIDPPDRSFIISNTGTEPMEWQVSGEPGWIRLSPSSGSLEGLGTQLVIVSVDSKHLTPGPHSTVLTVNSNAVNQPPVVTVELTQTVTFSVDDIAAALLGAGEFSQAQIDYLDTLGNQNAGLDLGDFVAWLDQVEAGLSAEVVQRIRASLSGRAEPRSRRRSP